eukprot:gene1545-2176_t
MGVGEVSFELQVALTIGSNFFKQLPSLDIMNKAHFTTDTLVWMGTAWYELADFNQAMMAEVVGDDVTSALKYLDNRKEYWRKQDPLEEDRKARVKLGARAPDAAVSGFWCSQYHERESENPYDTENTTCVHHEYDAPTKYDIKQRPQRQEVHGGHLATALHNTVPLRIHLATRVHVPAGAPNVRTFCSSGKTVSQIIGAPSKTSMFAMVKRVASDKVARSCKYKIGEKRAVVGCATSEQARGKYSEAEVLWRAALRISEPAVEAKMQECLRKGHACLSHGSGTGSAKICVAICCMYQHKYQEALDCADTVLAMPSTRPTDNYDDVSLMKANFISAESNLSLQRKPFARFA